jgi:thiol-disulfide isomerase/thioredoxin
MVVFFATWCGHCKALSFELTQLLRKIKEQKKYYQVIMVDVDKNEKLVEKFKVKGFPTIFIFNPNKTNYNGERTGQAWWNALNQ